MAAAISSPWLALSGERLALSSLVLVLSRFRVAHRLVGLVAEAQVMGTGIPIFRQVEVSIVVADNDTPIWLQIERSNPVILAPQLLWLSTETRI